MVVGKKLIPLWNKTVGSLIWDEPHFGSLKLMFGKQGIG
jgi:hypothetical protein